MLFLFQKKRNIKIKIAYIDEYLSKLVISNPVKFSTSGIIVGIETFERPTVIATSLASLPSGFGSIKSV